MDKPLSELLDVYPDCRRLNPRFLASGLHNHCFEIELKGERRVLRWRRRGAAGRTIRQAVEFEHSVHEFLAESGLTARLVSEQLYPGDSLTLEYLPGRYLDSSSQREMEMVGALYRELHSLDTERLDKLCLRRDVGDYLGDVKRYFEVLAQDCPVHLCKARDAMSEGLALESGQGRVLVHADGGFNNFLIGEKARFIDWEWAEVSYPQLDLAHFLSPMVVARKPGAVLGREALEAFWLGYHGLPQEPDWFPGVEQMRPLVELRALAWLAAREYRQKGTCQDLRLQPRYWQTLRQYRAGTRGLRPRKGEPKRP